MATPVKNGFVVVAIAFFIRWLAAGLTTVASVNPSSRSDAVAFGNAADSIAQGLMVGQPYLYTSGMTDTYVLWGTFLSPFWLLPGPSGFYARLGNAVLGAFAIYNVFLLARYYHSRQAGVIATLPMIFYPSFVAVQSTLLREAMVLFGITTAARLLILPSSHRSKLFVYGIAGGTLGIAYIHRPENAVIYTVAIGVGLAVYAINSGFIPKEIGFVGIALSPIAFLVALPNIQDGVQYLAKTRELRAGGRAVYLSDIIPESIPEIIGFSWIGGMYFLFAPFPWMIETASDLIVGFEGIVSLCFAVAGVWGIRSAARKNPAATVGLLTGLFVGIMLYGVGTANYGAASRHRQMFLWAIFLFGAIGISDLVSFRLSRDGNPKSIGDKTE